MTSASNIFSGGREERVPETEAFDTTRAPNYSVRARALVDEHYAFVWRSLRRLGVPVADVDDGVQRVFWVATRKLESIRPGAERSYLYQTALRVASAVRRGAQRRREVLTADPEDRTDPSLSAEEIVDLKRARARLDAILDQMELDVRAVFTLFELDRLSLSEIAELLDIPRGTAASRLRRARERFLSLSRHFEP